MDQAIYSKDVEQHSDLRDFINLRIGGFHATFAFLSFIGKELCDTDLKDAIVETGILGEDTAQEALRGKHNNNSMRTHLYVAEAITRVKLDIFLELLHFLDKYYVYGTVLKSDEVKKIGIPSNSDNLTVLQHLFNFCEEFENKCSNKKCLYGCILEFKFINDSNI